MIEDDRTPLRVLFACALSLVVLMCHGCGNSDLAPDANAEPTLQVAVDELTSHQKDIVKALRASNPAAADKAIHDALYLADHLADFESSVQVDKDLLTQPSTRLRELLMDAHRGAHGNTSEWDPNAAAEELTEIMSQLQSLADGKQ